jgi:anti-sigma regulatory factor (Ser/Thr protein kinase)
VVQIGIIQHYKLCFGYERWSIMIIKFTLQELFDGLKHSGFNYDDQEAITRILFEIEENFRDEDYRELVRRYEMYLSRTKTKET